MLGYGEGRCRRALETWKKITPGTWRCHSEQQQRKQIRQTNKQGRPCKQLEHKENFHQNLLLCVSESTQPPRKAKKRFIPPLPSACHPCAERPASDVEQPFSATMVADSPGRQSEHSPLDSLIASPLATAELSSNRVNNWLMDAIF